MKRWPFSLITITLIITIGCDKNEDPGYPAIPQIEFVDLTFDERSPNGYKDSLVLTIHYRDGDRDLGLTGDDDDSRFPYNYYNYFLEAQGELKPIATELRYSDFDYEFFKVDDGQTGKLATIRSRKKAAYSSLPPFNSCHYSDTTIFVSGEDKAIIDETYNVLDTLHASSGKYPDIFVVKDTFYMEFNENHYNIFIDYLIEQPDGSFAPYTWNDGSCDLTFEYRGRFPRITSSEPIDRDPFFISPESNWEGTLTYALKNNAFKIISGDKRIKLRISIKDRALHNSNVIETPAGTIESFKK